MRRAKDYVEPQAVGVAEAAALMGLHHVMPARMAEKGVLTAHVATQSANVEEPERFYALYDSEECDANYKEYDEKVSARGGKSDRRPRGWLHLRPDVIAHLRSVETPIAFDDAITLGEAAALLGVHHTLVPRMLREGKLVGRVAWNPRGKSTSRVWIVSRKSCLANVKEIKALEAAGKKPGRIRKKFRVK
jgi:hypothetical protein